VQKDFGDWDEVSTKFFDEESGLVTKAIEASGKAQ
jgi:sulfate transport system substrate-binding protein